MSETTENDYTIVLSYNVCVYTLINKATVRLRIAVNRKLQTLKTNSDHDSVLILNRYPF